MGQWQFVGFNLTDPLARLRLTLALDYPRKVSRIVFGATCLLLIFLIAIFLLCDISPLLLSFLGLLLAAIQYVRERTERQRVLNKTLKMDSHGAWQLVDASHGVRVVTLAHCIKSVFGYHLTLKIREDSLTYRRSGVKSFNVMIWRCNVDRQTFRHLAILTNWQMRQSDRLQSSREAV